MELCQTIYFYSVAIFICICSFVSSSQYDFHSYMDLEIKGAQCPPNYIFCLESFECVPDSPEFVAPSRHRLSDEECDEQFEQDGGLDEPMECPKGTVFCLESMSCIPLHPENCDEEDEEQLPLHKFCPVGTIFCVESMDCIPNPDLQSGGFDSEADCENPRKPLIPYDQTRKNRTKPQISTLKPVQKPAAPFDDKAETAKKPAGPIENQAESSSPENPKPKSGHGTMKNSRASTNLGIQTSSELPSKIKPTLPPGMAQDVREAARTINDKVQNIENFVANSIQGFGAGLRKIFG